MKADIQQYASEQWERAAQTDADTQRVETKLRNFNKLLSNLAQQRRGGGGGGGGGDDDMMMMMGGGGGGGDCGGGTQL
jgi:hypothetical protein